LQGYLQGFLDDIQKAPFMRPAMLSPFDILKDYERRGGGRELVAAPGELPNDDWRGIGYRLGAHLLVSPYKDVVEITRLPAITPVLGAQPWMAGLCNLNGELYPVIALRTFMDGQAVDLHEGQRVLVMDRGEEEGDVILVVDEIMGHRSFKHDTLGPAGEAFPPTYRELIDHAFHRDNTAWGVFSLGRLSTLARFQSASAL
jgi:twitching motility protein PilI